MSEDAIGILHPGEMGSAVGAALRAAGTPVRWASEGRGPDTQRRAAAAGLQDVGTLEQVLRESAVIVSICPPAAVMDVAEAVARRGFCGTYVDANAVSPATARAAGAIIERAGAVFVDGGIIGPPPRTRGTTRIYLSGPAAQDVAARFAGSVLEAIALDGPLTAASALKMAYGGWTKGSAALLMTMRALAITEGVGDALLHEWERSIPGLAARSERAVRDNARKAWRFVGEMEEIAEALATAELPDGFHRAAAEVYERLAAYKDAPTPPSAGEAYAALRQSAVSDHRR